MEQQSAAPLNIEQVETFIKGQPALIITYSDNSDVATREAINEHIESVNMPLKDQVLALLNASRFMDVVEVGAKPNQSLSYFKHRRSIGDIYRHMLANNPDVAIMDVYAVLMELIKEMKIYSFICGGIRRRVYIANVDLYKIDGLTVPKFVSVDTDEFDMNLVPLKEAYGIGKFPNTEAYGYHYTVEHLNFRPVRFKYTKQ